MQWGSVIEEVSCVHEGGPRLRDVYGIQYDSRRIAAGDIFVAIAGATTDGNQHVSMALSRGATCVITDSEATYSALRSTRQGMGVACVQHGRRALAQASAAVFAHPERELRTTAITGTNGKTTTAYLVEQLLAADARRSLLLGTVETRIDGRARPSEHTTPESRDVLALMREAVDAHCTEAVMEFSSHALVQKRVWGIPVDVAVFTNLTQDHLDFHGSMEAYAAAKAMLFHGVGTPPPRVAVLNADAPASHEMERAFAGSGNIFWYGIDAPHAEFRAEAIQYGLGSTRFHLRSPFGAHEVRSPLTGRINVENLLAAVCAVVARGVSLDRVLAAVPSLKPAPGRFEVVEASLVHGLTVVVDYAHTDDALHNLLTIARGVRAGGRIVTVFGCGGDRDRGKRPKMGRIAAELSDVVVLTSDNPRSEDPEQILREIAAGTANGHAEVVIEVDRRKAIGRAIALARPDDVVLIAGKGHETTQTIAGVVLAFDDRAEAERALAEVYG